MDSDEIRTILDRANDLLDAGEPAQALRCLESLSDARLEQEDRIECESMRAWALSELGRVADALELLEELIAEFPDCARLHGTYGAVLSSADDLEAGCAALEHSVSLDGEDEFALANLGLVYEKLCDYDRAKEVYERALELGFDIDWSLQRLAAVLSDVGDTAGAKGTIQRYLSLVPDDAGEWVSLAILHSDDREFEQAYACYRAAEQADSDSTWLRLNWGITAVRAGRWQDAAEQLRTLRSVDRAGVLPEVLEAHILEERSDAAGAERKYDAALARAAGGDEQELGYTLEMAMSFFAAQGLPLRCERLIEEAYASNLCTVEVCGGYRAATGEHLNEGTWYSVALEADYRSGLCEVVRAGGQSAGTYTRFTRIYQVVARDRDEAVAAVTCFAERMGESGVVLREILGEEAAPDVYSGIYEIQRESLVFADKSGG